MMHTIVWFTDDLRITDHPALSEALQEGTPVIGVYVVETRWGETTEFGFAKASNKRLAFLAQALEDLRERLASLNIPLIVKAGAPSLEIEALAKRYNVKTIYTHEPTGSEEAHRLNAVRRIEGVQIRSIFEKTLIHPNDLPFTIEAMPDVFTPFRKNVEATWHVRDPLDVPHAQKNFPTVYDADKPFPDFFEPTDAIALKGGESEGLKRLRYYSFVSDALSTYKQTRNGMLGFDDSSKLSPYLAHGCLSPRSIYATVRAYEENRTANQSTYWLIFELLWRDFFTFIHLKYGDALFKVGGIRGVVLPWGRDSQAFARWTQGTTGYPLVDGAMRELKTTGYMSNRARQNAASFLTKTLGIDWRMGAAWFEHHLIDYDVSSNWGNWNYIAGVGNDAREFRFFNVITQGERYDPQGAFAQYWIPELRQLEGSMVYRIHELSQEFLESQGIARGTTYPDVMVDFKSSVNQWKQIFLNAFKT